MSTEARRAREKQDLRRRIVLAARELFVTEGYDKVSMRKIAERIDYSPTTIYLYFRNKAELLDTVCEETQTRLLKRIEALFEDLANPVEALRKCARAYARFGLDYPEDYKLMVIQRPQYQKGLVLAEGSVVEKLFGYLHALVEECVRQKQIRAEEPEMTSQAIWAAVHGAVSLVISYPDFPWVDREALVSHVIDTMIEGLAI